MPDKWMTVAEAATALKVHPRTIERRIAGGKIQSRRTDDGTLHVMLSLPDAPVEQSPDNSGALETVRELADNQVTLATGSASAIVKFAQSDAMRAREELQIVRQDVGRARKSALAAWCVVATIGIGVCVAVGWTASKITAANERIRQATDQARQLDERAAAIRQETDKLIAKVEQDKKQLQQERDTARQEAEQARLAGAEAKGQLVAYQEQSAKRPTTQPRTRIQRALAALSEPD